MMKYSKSILCFFAMSLFLTACSARPAVPSPAEVENDHYEACYMPTYFASEEQLVETIQEVRTVRTARGKLRAEGDTRIAPEEDDVIIAANKAIEFMAHDQSYNASIDRSDLTSISVLYRPATIPRDLSLYVMAVESGRIEYRYANKEHSKFAYFAYFPKASPDVAMNELFGRGAISEREIEHNGIKYVFLEWLDPDTNTPAGFSVHWVENSRAYQASITGYTDDEMLAFCQYETVAVK